MLAVATILVKMWRRKEVLALLVTSEWAFDEVGGSVAQIVCRYLRAD